MAVEDRVDRRAQPHDAAAHVEIGHGEGDDPIVEPGGPWCRPRPSGRHSAEAPGQDALLRVQAVLGSSKTADCGPSMIASVTSSPREAGRQCMKIASFSARCIRRSST
jgi:hypothetical protein